MSARQDKKKSLPVMHLVTGSISGAVSRTLTNPLERLKMLKQVKIPEYEGLSSFRSLIFMWQKEGMFGLLKGNGVNVVRIAPFTAFEMFFYDFYKWNLFGGDQASVSSKLICGGLTGMTASTLTYPLDLIRTVLAVKVDGDVKKSQSIMGCARQIIAKDGVLGLFRGWPTTMIGITPFVGIKMSSFDIIKTYMKIDAKDQMSNFLLGGLAGTIAVTITYPTDLIRRKLQMVGHPGYPHYSGLIDCATSIFKEEGIKGWYRGLWACYLKVAPTMAILFWCNERLKVFLDV